MCAIARSRTQCAVTATALAGGLLIRHARPLIKEGFGVPSSVVVKNGHIGQIGDGDLKSLDDLPVLDAREGWLLPAPSDLHCHLCYDYPRRYRHKDDPLINVVSTGNAAAKLAAGVTLVRDLGGISQRNIGLARQIDKGALLGPEMLTAGDIIAAPGGHMSHYARQVRGQAEMRQAVRDQVLAGAEWVKLMVSGGVAAAGERWDYVQLSQADVTAAVDEAHALGAHVAAHAHPKSAILQAIASGCDTIEHATFVDQEVIDALLKSNTTIVPTLSVYDRIRKGGDAIDQGLAATVQVLWEAKLPALRGAFEAGVRIGVGTDSGGSFPANDIATEMRLMEAELGISAMQVIRMATYGNGLVLGRPSISGYVESGAVADLIIVDSDPLGDLSALSRVTAVIKSGNVVGAPA